MKLEVTPDGLIFSEVFSGIGIRTPMGLFGIAQRDDGIEVLYTNPRTKKTSTVFVASGTASAPALATHSTLALARHVFDQVPERVRAYVDGPRIGKGAVTVVGTISRKEFVTAFQTYCTRGGQQTVEGILRAGFTYQELEGLLGHTPTSWIEDKVDGVSGGRLEDNHGGTASMRPVAEASTGERPKGKLEGGT
jgi:hypothetical protein